MDQDIDEVTKCCDICFKPVLSRPSANEPLSRLHIDYADPLDNKYFFVIADSLTKSLNVQVTNSITSSAATDLLKKSFCNFGLPEVIV